MGLYIWRKPEYEVNLSKKILDDMSKPELCIYRVQHSVRTTGGIAKKKYQKYLTRAQSIEPVTHTSAEITLCDKHKKEERA